MAGLLTKWQAQGYQHNAAPSALLSATYVQLQAPASHTGLETEPGFGSPRRCRHHETGAVQPGSEIPRQPAHPGMVNPTAALLNSTCSLLQASGAGSVFCPRCWWSTERKIGSRSLIKASKATSEKSAAVKSSFHNEVVPNVYRGCRHAQIS